MARLGAMVTARRDHDKHPLLPQIVATQSRSHGTRPRYPPVPLVFQVESAMVVGEAVEELEGFGADMVLDALGVDLGRFAVEPECK